MCIHGTRAHLCRQFCPRLQNKPPTVGKNTALMRASEREQADGWMSLTGVASCKWNHAMYSEMLWGPLAIRPRTEVWLRGANMTTDCLAPNHGLFIGGAFGASSNHPARCCPLCWSHSWPTREPVL